jgi:putative nucleotidyltransferase with HDIG domain
MTKTVKNGTENLLSDLVKTLVSVIEEKDVFIKGHSERVAGNCVAFAKKLGLPAAEIQRMYLPALLHDIGMVYIPLSIIQKPGRLTRDEMKMVEQHPVIAEKILSHLTIMKGLLPIIRHHHEAFDGSGYPDGLRGDKIPMGARILALVNSFDAMTSTRSHRPAMSVEEALEEIYGSAGGKFDNDLIDAFVAHIESTGGVFDGAEGAAEEEEEPKTVREILLEIVDKFKRGQIDPPVLPNVVQELKSVISNPNSTADDLAAVIEQDAIISLRLISVANSPVYRGIEEIRTVRNAIPRLGLKETQNVVAAIANKSLFETKAARYRKLMERLWKHSLACAYASRAIAKRLFVEVDVEQIFLMGLIHDIGKAILIQSLSQIDAKEKLLDMDAIIEGIQGAHCGFGGALLQRWKFPQEFIKVARLHEGNGFGPSTDRFLLVINLANHLAINMGYGLTDDGKVDLAGLDSAELLEMDSDSLLPVRTEVKEIMRSSAQFF